MIRASNTPNMGLKENTNVALLTPRYLVEIAYDKILIP